MQDQILENRAHRRYPLRARGHLYFTGNRPLPIKALDVSVSGICVVSEITVPINIRGELEFNMPIGGGQYQMMRVNVQIMRCIFSSSDDGFRLGILFLKPPADLVKLILKMT